MKNLIVLLSLFAAPLLTANETLNLNQFAQEYYQKMMATQAPDADHKTLETYLALLTDDVASTHLPYVTDDTRSLDGKKTMKQGMSFYLGSHTEFNSELLDVFIFNTTAVAIRYKKSAKGIHPQNNQAISYSQTMMEILEIENGKVAIIRKYHE